VLSTTEVRWFYQGEIPTQIQTWFGLIANENMSQASREDFYLLSTSGGRFGIKLRGNLLEIKERTKTHGPYPFSPEISGIIESWHKLSFPLADKQSHYDAVQGISASWIGVKKTRHLFPRSSPSGEYCHFELTQVEALRQSWWTLGFEAAGKVQGNYDSLVESATQIFSTANSPALERVASSGYPDWLEILTVER
jgi:hypothetical protein